MDFVVQRSLWLGGSGASAPSRQGVLVRVCLRCTVWGLDAAEFSTDVGQDADGATVIYVRGEIDIATCERLRDAIEPHLGPRQTIVLDLSEVEFMDSSSLHVLEQARGTLTADGGSLILRNPSRAARLLLTAARATELLDEDAEQEASGD